MSVAFFPTISAPTYSDFFNAGTPSMAMAFCVQRPACFGVYNTTAFLNEGGSLVQPTSIHWQRRCGTHPNAICPITPVTFTVDDGPPFLRLYLIDTSAATTITGAVLVGGSLYELQSRNVTLNVQADKASAFISMPYAMYSLDPIDEDELNIGGILVGALGGIGVILGVGHLISIRRAKGY